jgi:hypothetical protein
MQEVHIMPMVLIEIARKYSQEQEIALMKAVHSALIEAFKVTYHAINVRLLVHEGHRFTTPVHTNPELYTLISIDCFTGRSPSASSPSKSIAESRMKCDFPYFDIS